MRRERERMFKRYVASKRHTMQVDFDNYLYELGKETQGRRRARASRGLRSPVTPRTAPARRGRRHEPAGRELGKRAGPRRITAAAISRAAREVFAEIGYDAAGVRDVIRRTDLASGLSTTTSPTRRRCFARWSTRARRGPAAIARGRARREFAGEFVGDAYRAWFEFLVEDRLMFELMQRNAGPIRPLFGDPILGAGVEELFEDLRAAMIAATCRR